jgi:hypothetical protein
MDGPRFDTLARALASRRSRRRLLAGLIGAGLGLTARPPVSAADCPALSPCWFQRRLNPWSGDTGAPESPNMPAVASKAESVPMTDLGVATGQSGGPVPEVCYGDDCERDINPAPPQCAGGLTKCGGVCVNLSSDPNNCGACGVRCPPGWQSCSGGTCACSRWCTVRTCETIIRNGKAETRCYDNPRCC